MRRNIAVTSFAAALAFLAPAEANLSLAASSQVTVPGTSMPWSAAGKLNRNRQFGSQDGTAPVVVTLASIGAAPGQRLAMRYLSGTVCPGGSYPCGDAKGYAGFVTDHNTGNSGNYFPSRYIAKEPTYLAELIGVFTDAAGKIIGRPFAVPDAGTHAIPSGASQLQFGVNDDIFGDNSGSWLIALTPK